MNNENFGIAYGGGLVRNKKVSKGELLSFGTGIKGWDNERSLNNDVFSLSSDGKKITLKRNAMLQMDGMFSNSMVRRDGTYCYLNIKVNGKFLARLAGLSGDIGWENDISFTNRFTFQKGDVIELEADTNYPDVFYNYGVDFIRIQELGKESWFWE
ncbi:hypothetical protein [Enterococcus alishanensis]